MISQIGELFGYLSALLFFVSYLPQLWTLLTTNRTDGINVGMFYVCLAAYVCGMFYMFSTIGFKAPMFLNFLCGSIINIIVIGRIKFLRANNK